MRSSVPVEHNNVGPGTKMQPFSWEDICVYLYGHLPIEPAILEGHRLQSKPKENGRGNLIFYRLF